MLASYRLAAVLLAATIGVSASAADDFVRASSSGSTVLNLCSKGSAIGEAGCKAQPYDALSGKIQDALRAALAKASANMQPLLKRDQVWFNELVLNIVQDNGGDDSILALLKQRTETLATIVGGFGRPGLAGRWVDAFGSVTVTPAGQGAYHVAVDTHAGYRSGEESLWDCHFAADLALAGDGWLKGTVPAKDRPELKATPLKMRRQGETLRVVVDAGEDEAGYACLRPNQITGSYFASGGPDPIAAADKADTSFIAPSFDCVHPHSASDEEICSDPELADNDVRLNRAWKALLPRLDDTTRRALSEDQRNWVKAQAWQYPEHLHPAWAKRTYFMHHAVDGRDQLRMLQRERLALLEGFDEGRKGLAGLWLGYTAILNVKIEGDDVTAEGGKWMQGSWKDGCEYSITGTLTKGVFRSDDERINPDTLERDHATLMVNRQDDAFAKKRFGDDGKAGDKAGDKADEAKCRRNASISSTARLFPVRPSPDIDAGQKSIR